MLAQLLKWPFALPLLAAHLFPGSGRRAGPGAAAVDENWVCACCLAYARAAAQACDLSADLERRAKKLLAVAPKLRAKGAGAALQALLDDDSLSAATKIGTQMSERGARRLFDRLVALGAIRELTGTVDVPALRAIERWREPENPQASWIRNSRTCPRPRAGANGWVASRRSSSLSAEPVRGRIWRAWSARPATSTSSSTTSATNCAGARMRSSPSRAAGVFARSWASARPSGPRRRRRKTELSRSNALVLMAIGYFQPITRGELSQFFGREVSRDAIAALRGEGLIAAGPRSPTPGAPYAYVTTPAFLSHFGFESLRDLPDIEKLEDAGLLGRASEALPGGDALASELAGVLGLSSDEDEPQDDAA